ncbi:MULTISPECIES: sensor histidine kinase [unclassified Streptomyces]|uniref:histidine kinase n=1 Tax=Streptomyces sp. NBC_00119 TaxID=2975659 RepID=A0AAU1U591_9ACTN|nr:MULTISPECIES: sensor histidine kinase [unclassified Streptomyces]MCX4643090.1 sensor histidine kinase [Streptomyces sp. NBC_01446]MCX5324215.1 sensor histidine kinase [Streptomyces sp. NBC_00120]
MRLPLLPRARSLAGQLFAMQVVLVAVVVAGCALFTYISDGNQAEQAATRQATAAARAVADAPSVRGAITGDGDPTRTLQPYASDVQRHTGVDFVTIMDPHGIRWTHPDERRIGERFLGHIGPALRGRTFSETYTGTLGPSVRVVTPIMSGQRIVGLVSAGITVEEISAQARGQVMAVAGVAAGALVLGGIGTYVINARLRRHTHGMNATELSRMHAYHQAALHAVREGLVMLDGQRRIALINDGARELLGVGDETVGRNVAELGLPTPLTGALLAAEPRVDEVHLTTDRVVVVNTSPVSSGDRRGTVVTLRDHTELQAVMGELDSERGFTQALRSQAHEAANRLHTVVSLIELDRADEAVDFATAELELAQTLTDQVVAAVSEPVLAALLLGKTAQANEHGVELEISGDSRIDDGLVPPTLPARDLVTILGNLLDNAVDAAQGSPHAKVTVTARAQGDTLLLRVTDTGPGVADSHTDAVFERGWSTKPAGPGGRGLGLALVQQSVARNSGTLTLAESPTGGAQFTVVLPLQRTSATTPTGGTA